MVYSHDYYLLWSGKLFCIKFFSPVLQKIKYMKCQKMKDIFNIIFQLSSLLSRVIWSDIELNKIELNEYNKIELDASLTCRLVSIYISTFYMAKDMNIYFHHRYISLSLSFPLLFICLSLYIYLSIYIYKYIYRYLLCWIWSLWSLFESSELIRAIKHRSL